jgi:spore germination protein YaaH
MPAPQKPVPTELLRHLRTTHDGRSRAQVDLAAVTPDDAADLIRALRRARDRLRSDGFTVHISRTKFAITFWMETTA